MALPPIRSINNIPQNGAEWQTDGPRILTEISQTADDIEAFRVALEAGYEGEGVSGTYQFALVDNSGNPSPTVVTGNWYQIGKLVMVSIRDLNAIVTTGMVLTDILRAPLPFPQKNSFRGFGVANFSQLASVTGNGSQLVARPTQNGLYVQIANVGGTFQSNFLTVGDIDSGVSKLIDLSLSYVRA